MLARERGQRVWELIAHLALAEALTAEQGAKARLAAEQALGRAADLVAETGARVYEPQIAEGRARLARSCGEAGASERHLRDAHRLYSEIGAGGHARRVAALLEEGAA
jgi:hypothetical protein